MSYYRPEIDGLRAIAVFSVILFHAGFELVSGGYVGVDVFFVISGYLITQILLKDLQEDRFSIWKFYERRARRILPALVFVIICMVPFAVRWMYPSQLIDFSAAILAVALFCSNILFWRQSDYFAPEAEENPLLHTWSLAVEEQFYIFFPILLLLLFKFSRKRIFLFLLVLAIASLILSEIASRITPGANFYLLPTRAWELLAGSLCAMWKMQGRFRSNGVIAFIGLALIFIAIFAFDDQTPFPSVYALIPVCGTVLVVLFADEKNLPGKILSLRLMVGIGLISYSAYLWHQPLFAFTRLRVGDAFSPQVSGLLIGATFVLAALSWKFVEQPFRAGDHTVLKTRRSVFLASGIALSCLLAIGAVGFVGKGLPERIAPSGESFATLNIDERLQGNPGLGPGCGNGFERPDSCRTQGDPRVLLWGDSFAMHLAGALEKSQDAQGLVQYTMPACAPIKDISLVNSKFTIPWARKCIAFNDKVLDWLRNNEGVEYVIMSSPMGILRDRVYHRDNGLFAEGIEQIIIDEMRSTAHYIRQLGAIPVFVAPPPRTGENLASCGVTALIFGEKDESRCAFREADIWAETHKVASVLHELEPDMRIFSLQDIICQQGSCATFADDTLLFRDKGHFSNAGSKLLGAKENLLGQILALEKHKG